jgi:hypothetical protein
MSTNRLYVLFGLISLLALATVGLLANTSLGLPFNLGPKPAVSGAAAEAARLDQRRGEWFAGEQNLYAPLDQHDRHPSVAGVDPEIQRFVSYSNSVLAAQAEQARLAQRRGEWFAGAPSVAAVGYEFQSFLWYTKGIAGPAAFDVEQARLQWRAGK